MEKNVRGRTMICEATITTATILILSVWGCGEADSPPVSPSGELQGDARFQLEASRLELCAVDFDPRKRSKALNAKDPEMLIMGEPNRGRIEASDRTAERGYYWDRWAFFICESRNVVIEMKSDEIDSELVLMRQYGESNSVYVARDDDAGEGLDARIEMILQPGFYFVGAFGNPLLQDPFGPYSISVH